MKTRIQILKMGGTIEFIDPSYDQMNREIMKVNSSVDNYLKNVVKPHFSYSVEHICEKDSRDITREDLDRLGGS